MESDAQLLADTRPEAFERFVLRHHRPIHRYVTRRLGPDDAMEIVNDVFLIAYRRRNDFDERRTDAGPWLYGIATNLVRSRRRDEARQLRRLAATGVDPVAPTETGARVAISAEVAAALAGMPRKHRDVLFLYAVADLTLDQIAEAMGVPVGSVKSWLHRARIHAARHLRPTTDGTTMEHPE